MGSSCSVCGNQFCKANIRKISYFVILGFNFCRLHVSNELIASRLLRPYLTKGKYLLLLLRNISCIGSDNACMKNAGICDKLWCKVPPFPLQFDFPGLIVVTKHAPRTYTYPVVGFLKPRPLSVNSVAICKRWTNLGELIKHLFVMLLSSVVFI